MAKEMQHLVDTKHEELKIAMDGGGDKTMSEQYKHLKVTQVQWRDMSYKQRHEHIELVSQEKSHSRVSFSISYKDYSILRRIYIQWNWEMFGGKWETILMNDNCVIFLKPHFYPYFYYHPHSIYTLFTP